MRNPLLPALEAPDTDQRTPTLTDLGYVSVSPAIRHPYKKATGETRQLGGYPA